MHQCRYIAPEEDRWDFEGLSEVRTLFFEFALCLSRACLGKIIVFTYKWLKKKLKTVISHCKMPSIPRQAKDRRNENLISSWELLECLLV